MSGPTGPAAKTERLMNLVLCLLYTRRPLPKSRIRQMVEAYQRAASDEAFDRMFERDKDELRELGIPLVTEDLNSIFDDEPGYRIDRREYALPDLHFEPDELAVLGLASRTWAQASLAGPAAEALRKLRASGIERDTDSLIGIEPRLGTVEPAFEATKNAVLDRVPIRFPYRTGGSAESAERHVQPWGLAAWHGRWYLTAYDLDRRAPRVFRLSRIDGRVERDGPPGSYDIPAGHNARDMIRTEAPGGEARPAVIRVRRGAGHVLRRRARTVGQVDDTWSLLDVDYADADAFADELAGYGPDVVVEQPPHLAELVIRRFEGVLREHAVSREGAAP
ncbi:MAG TPA: WYL domain-containing protein [Dermatophilaceae bacterium]|jgi:proteasome accessory factor B|nr:WYL domain-containing protein [Dermatophilaceae bacterium]